MTPPPIAPPLAAVGTWIAAVVAVLVVIVLLAIFARRTLVRAPFKILLPLLYRKRVVGLENLPREGGCVVVSNHVSWIDGVLILWMLPRNVRFVVDGANFGHPVMRFLGDAFDTILMMPSPKAIGRALKEAREGIKSGSVIGIFPEGTLTRTGQLQAFKPGVSKILKGTDAPVVPMYMEGMWGSLFSFSGGKFFLKRPKVIRRTLTLYIGRPLPSDAPPTRMRDEVAKLAKVAHTEQRRHFGNPVRGVLRSWKRRGSRLQIADSTGRELTGRRTLISTLALRRVLRREVLADDERHVAILLPPSVAAVTVNAALAIDHRVAVNLNYTATADILDHCNDSVGVRHVLTSRKFVEKTGIELSAESVMMEDVAEKVTSADKAIAAVASYLPSSWLIRILGLSKLGPDDLMTVIFTSGSTGMPKGVELTCGNVGHNVEAIGRALKLNSEDVVLGVLPFFHSFGYTVTLWAANCLGPMSAYHFNPLDGRQVGKLAERFKATVLLGTPTFFRTYLRRVEPEQFANIDVAVVGAEKMPPELFEQFEQRFGVRPVEGYGATETAPLVSVNIPPSRSFAKFQPDREEGSVGRPVAGVSVRVVAPETDDDLPAGEDGMLLVGGPNVMRGYAGDAEKTAATVRDGWYVTGDIAHLDNDGFIHITGRLSRFSKIGGEMVPHIKVEETINAIVERHRGDASEEEGDGPVVAVTAVPCSKKGERLIVLHRELPVDVATIRKEMTAAGLPNLFIPSEDSFIEVEGIPLLGTGKLDLRGVKEMAKEVVG